MNRPQAISIPLVEDQRVRVTRYEFAAGAETGWHVHEHDYVVAALTDLTMMLQEPGGGIREVFVAAGSAYRRNAGVEHNVINNSASEMRFVEVELLPA